MISEMPRIFAAAVLLGATFAWSQAKADSSPRISSTDPEYLGCSAWTGKDWASPTGRSARTPVVESRTGLRAYAKVEGTVSGQECNNRTSLYVASARNKDFKLVYSVPGSDGNGIRLIGWSPNGNRLLAELSFWKYETDRGFGYVPLIYDESEQKATQIETATEAIAHYFGTDCEFEPSVRNWKGNSQFLIRASRTPPDDSYEQKYCVKGSILFTFDLIKESVRPVGPK